MNTDDRALADQPFSRPTDPTDDQWAFWLKDAASILRSNGTTDHADWVQRAADSLEPFRAKPDGATVEPIADGKYRLSITTDGEVTDIYEGPAKFILRTAFSSKTPVHLAALQSPPPVVSGEADWVWVPREPTPEMLAASEREWDGRMSFRSTGAWQAMLNAAPVAPRFPMGDPTPGNSAPVVEEGRRADLAETVARALVIYHGHDPDELVQAGDPIGNPADYPAWMLGLPEARAVADAILAPTPVAAQGDEIREALKEIARKIDKQADCLDHYAVQSGHSEKPVPSVFHLQSSHFRDLAKEILATLTKGARDD